MGGSLPAWEGSVEAKNDGTSGKCVIGAETAASIQFEGRDDPEGPDEVAEECHRDDYGNNEKANGDDVKGRLLVTGLFTRGSHNYLSLR
jgi:hypothetical protein